MKDLAEDLVMENMEELGPSLAFFLPLLILLTERRRCRIDGECFPTELAFLEHFKLKHRDIVESNIKAILIGLFLTQLAHHFF